MKNQTLPLADQFFTELDQGLKTRTLRWNEPKIETGFLTFYSEKNPEKVAIVYATSIRYGRADAMATLYEITTQELLTGMKKHYKDIPNDATFMLIDFLPPNESEKISGYNSFKTLSVISV